MTIPSLSDEIWDEHPATSDGTSKGQAPRVNLPRQAPIVNLPRQTPKVNLPSTPQPAKREGTRIIGTERIPYTLPPHPAGEEEVSAHVAKREEVLPSIKADEGIAHAAMRDDASPSIGQEEKGARRVKHEELSLSTENFGVVDRGSAPPPQPAFAEPHPLPASDNVESQHSPGSWTKVEPSRNKKQKRKDAATRRSEAQALRAAEIGKLYAPPGKPEVRGSLIAQLDAESISRTDGSSGPQPSGEESLPALDGFATIKERALDEPLTVERGLSEDEEEIPIGPENHGASDQSQAVSSLAPDGLAMGDSTPDEPLEPEQILSKKRGKMPMGVGEHVESHEREAVSPLALDGPSIDESTLLGQPFVPEQKSKKKKKKGKKKGKKSTTAEDLGGSDGSTPGPHDAPTPQPQVVDGHSSPQSIAEESPDGDDLPQGVPPRPESFVNRFHKAQPSRKLQYGLIRPNRVSTVVGPRQHRLDIHSRASRNDNFDKDARERRQLTSGFPLLELFKCRNFLTNTNEATGHTFDSSLRLAPSNRPIRLATMNAGAYLYPSVVERSHPMEAHNEDHNYGRGYVLIDNGSNHDRKIGVVRHLADRLDRIRRRIREMSQDLGCLPEARELRDHLGSLHSWVVLALEGKAPDNASCQPGEPKYHSTVQLQAIRNVITGLAHDPANLLEIHTVNDCVGGLHGFSRRVAAALLDKLTADSSQTDTEDESSDSDSVAESNSGSVIGSSHDDQPEPPEMVEGGSEAAQEQQTQPELN